MCEIGQKVITYVNDPYLTYSDYISEKISNTMVRDLNVTIEFVTVDNLELSESSDDEDQHDKVEPIAESDQSTYKGESTDAEDDIPLSAISAAKITFIDREKQMY